MREVVGISGFVVGMVWGRFMVLGSYFGCLEVFGSDGAALLKKEVPKVERDLYMPNRSLSRMTSERGGVFLAV